LLKDSLNKEFVFSEVVELQRLSGMLVWKSGTQELSLTIDLAGETLVKAHKREMGAG